MIKKFFKQLFCLHEYEETGYWRCGSHVSISYRCPKCGKEKFEYFEY